jgi:D-alanyl-D-alanine dipeptidase
MINKTILTYNDIKDVNDGSSDEALISVRRYDNSIAVQYEKFDMLAYVGFKILVRETVARKLAKVNNSLNAKYKLALKVVYGYRALEVQTNYFNERQTELASSNSNLSRKELRTLTHNFVAVPEVAGHVTGGAVDVTLITLDGLVCDMGTKIADYTDENRIRTFDNGITVDQRRLRKILLEEMMAEGFAPFLGEWWHFSYGDKEWAAYYKIPAALYGPVDLPKTATVLRIAGGNETVIQTIEDSQGEYISKRAGGALLNSYSIAEQAGLLYVSEKRLEMAGGEFCGNASAAAAVLLAEHSNESTVRYEVSGFKGYVVAEVKPFDCYKYRVRTTFRGMDYIIKNVEYESKELTMVDMGGIVHVLIEDNFPEREYQLIQRKLVNELHLSNRDAVGVIWYMRQAGKVNINPVVWVRKIDTLYYESACGSGAIAAALCTGVSKIVQPTRESIFIYINGENVTTDCEVVRV